MIKASTHLKTFLVISGLCGVIVGLAILFFPVPFYATSALDVSGKVALLNELKAPGGSLLVSGTLVLLGGFFRRLTYTALLVSTLTYLAYGSSRVLSMMVDGLPNMTLIVVSIFEIVVATWGLYLWSKVKHDDSALGSAMAR